ncbi:MAG: acyl-ACP--UDP-N-acetylglucosamine O-acyltransferase [Candidatus Aceula meridiana]|nr:acyl-ACP--UDP-N-acetylglucosamine O-acyltransferase [Candidatus Aceula meridiana]
MSIHKTAIIHANAKIDEGAQVGAYAIIGEGVSLAVGVKIGSFCVVEGNTTVGKNTELFTGAVVGSIPQDRKYNSEEKTYLEIGEDNIFREYVTVNPGTGEGGKTIIGDNNLFMAYSHVAHDCIIGNNCTLANSGTLAGHVTLEDNAVIGGLTAVHQFVRLGKLSIVGGCSKVVQDIPPYSVCDGHPARVYGLNSVGLKRAKFSSAQLNLLKKAVKILFFSDLTKKTAVEKIQKELEATEETKHLIHFVQTSQRGLCS